MIALVDIHPDQAAESAEEHMPAYWLARAKVIDPDQYKKYTDRLPPIIAKYGDHTR